MIYYCMVDLFLPLDQIDLLSQLDFQNQSILEVVFILEIVNFCGTEGRPSFFPWTCELSSQEMDCVTGNFTRYLKSINKFDLFFSFCRWKVLGILMYFSCIKQQTSTKYHKKKKSGWHCCGSQEGKKKKPPCRGGTKMGESFALVLSDSV